MSSATPAILALGEAMLEFNQARADTPDAYLRGFGGDTSNMAIAAARLLNVRGRVGYVTRVGDDPFGRSCSTSGSAKASTRERRDGRRCANRRLLRHPRTARPGVFVSARGIGSVADAP
jgi:hypothetical protein